jgi:hypothetical protein
LTARSQERQVKALLPALRLLLCLQDSRRKLHSPIMDRRNRLLPLNLNTLRLYSHSSRKATILCSRCNPKLRLLKLAFGQEHSRKCMGSNLRCLPPRLGDQEHHSNRNSRKLPILPLRLFGEASFYLSHFRAVINLMAARFFLKKGLIWIMNCVLLCN